MGDVETLEDELSQLLSSRASSSVSASLATYSTSHTPVRAKMNPEIHRVPSQVELTAPIDVQDEDVLSKVKQDLLSLGNMFANQGTAFRERATTLASINYLAANVPSSVLEHLGREVRHFSAEVNIAKSDLAPILETQECETGDPQRCGRPSLYSADSSDALISSLPYVAPSLGAVLFCKILRPVDEFRFSQFPFAVDIAGFTAMSADHGPETVTKLTSKFPQRVPTMFYYLLGCISR